MLQPESAWHAGAEGWSVAPYPGWGSNPALVGPKRLGVEGLGEMSGAGIVVAQIALMAGVIGVALYLSK